MPAIVKYTDAFLIIEERILANWTSLLAFLKISTLIIHLLFNSQQNNDNQK